MGLLIVGLLVGGTAGFFTAALLTAGKVSELYREIDRLRSQHPALRRVGRKGGW
jgi:gas vesicle protein